MQHHFILRYLRRPSRHDHHHHFRRFHSSNDTSSSISSISSINWVRDRALDHAVEKERDLKPMINVKNLINSEPSKSLPLSIISDKRSALGIPTRPIDFIRKYPSVFHEFFPGGIGIHPHVKLTPETLTLDAEEQILFQSEIHKIDVANRLLKLLMLARINKIPLSVIDRLKWDLGLPNDYAQIVVPQFPDYFKVTGDELELVCWSDELAVSVMQSNSMSSFPVQYSRGFEIDKKFKKWVDDWQKLPYVSPYENASNLLKSEESDKWVVGLLHEVLHLLVPKKTEKDNLLFLGEYLGVRSRFKKALLQHPGIFYVSSKLNTHTVVLREAYKRDLLVSKVRHPLMNLRSNYIHLMNMVKEKSKSKDAEHVGVKKQKASQDSDGEDDELSENQEDDSETEDVMDSDSDNDMERDNIVVVNARTPTERKTFERRNLSDQRGSRRRSNQEDDCENEDVTDNDSNSDMERDNMIVNPRTPTKRKTFERQNLSDPRGRRRRSNDNGESLNLENGNSKIRGRTSRTVMFNDSHKRNTPNSRVNDNDGRRRGRGENRKHAFDEKSYSRTNRMSDRRVRNETNPSRFLRTEAPGARVSDGRSSERSSTSRTREGWSSERSNASRTREGRSSERSSASRTREGRSSERSSASRTREGRSSERLNASRTRDGRSSERSSTSRTRDGRSSERSSASRTRDGRSSERSGASRTKEGRF
ncbi:hypothetical protein L1987_64370 [Smallanthus sonchifolius]|uniref:Uncharacterized protein n=1 Tax=Smallanthus sonchifolius TaxID=185202 RepID=A0ACB9CG89_9ASTR|nr:hypothetical protein L1987_64370 [Smallanthus sonchifolius]